MKDDELWMKKMKEKLADYSGPTPVSGWERLEKELTPPVEKKIIPYWRWASAVAAVLLLAAVTSVGLYFLGTPAADDMRQTQVPVLAMLPDALPDAQQPDSEAGKVTSALLPVAPDRLARAEQRIVSGPAEHETADDSVSSVDDAGGEDVRKNDYETLSSIEREDGNTVSQVRKQERKPRRPSSKDKFHLPAEAKDDSKGRWSLSLSVENAAGATAQGSGFPVMARVSMLAVSNGFLEIPNDKTVVFEDGIPYLLQKNRVLDVKHHQPISFGVSFRKSLPKGFSLETGLVYTLLSSDLKVENHDGDLEQKLHYMGIPLRASWNFLDKKLFTLYVSGGGMMEKCVYGKVGTEKETVKPLQFSVSGAVGAQLNATRHVGIYVEPGVSYYFDDGSDVQTIRKENPFQFNVRAGVRFTY